MSMVEQQLSDASFQKVRSRVGGIIRQAGLTTVLDPRYIHEPDKLPEFVDVMLEYLFYGSPANGGSVYFERRPDGLTEAEYLTLLLTVLCAEVTFEQDFQLELSDYVRGVLGRITLGVKLALDEELSQMGTVVLRIRLVEDLLRERGR